MTLRPSFSFHFDCLPLHRETVVLTSHPAPLILDPSPQSVLHTLSDLFSEDAIFYHWSKLWHFLDTYTENFRHSYWFSSSAKSRFSLFDKAYLPFLLLTVLAFALASLCPRMPSLPSSAHPDSVYFSVSGKPSLGLHSPVLCLSRHTLAGESERHASSKW